MSVIARYQDAVQQGAIHLDPLQQNALNRLERIYERVIHEAKYERRCLTRIIRLWRLAVPIRGLYLWGGVGIGKTYLLDLFYDSLPNGLTLRQHFHAFMRDIHHQLTQRQGTSDPLMAIATQFAKQYRVLCLDEFFVQDIGDAMILGNLLRALFHRGVTLIVTSNVAPDDLYRSGLQRDLFLPAISALKMHLEIIHLKTQVDYRQSDTQYSIGYYFPLTDAVSKQMHSLFIALSNGRYQCTPIQVNERSMNTVAWSESVVWFDFFNLCQIPRSQYDYLTLTDQFSCIMLSDVPAIREAEDHLVTYLIYLVDVCYDKKIRLILSAAVPINQLYPHGRKWTEFQRTQSRLQEMQTKAYIDASINNR